MGQEITKVIDAIRELAIANERFALADQLEVASEVSRIESSKK